MKNKLSYIIAIILSFFIGVCGTIITIKYMENKEPEIQEVVTKNITLNETDTIASSVEKVYDAVVTVSNYTTSLSGIGTGFVYKVDDKYGYILTNNHVISGAHEIKVTNTQDVTNSAVLLGSDEYADLAVLRVDKDFVIQTAVLGTSTDLRIGDTVFAVGTPVSVTYAGSVTKGIISGKTRTVPVTLDNGGSFLMEVLQTNAAINPGNSGGPLVNLKGEVVGINTLKLVKDEIEGMGFSIPIEMASSVLDRLEQGKKIERPLLGVSMIDANNSYSLYRYQIFLEKDYEKGVIVVDVEKNSTASEMGLQKKDVILKINGIQIEDNAHFKYILYKYSVGDKITLEYERNGVTKTTSAVIKNTI